MKNTSTRRLRRRVRELIATGERGLEQSTWTAIMAVGGGVLALTVLGVIGAWAASYLGKLPG